MRYVLFDHDSYIAILQDRFRKIRKIDNIELGNSNKLQ